jgi:NAD(P)-dependent dehydrogenase (short-subunit alcohol dehydrogenase family)
MQSDATSSTDMQAFVDACMTRHQRIDVLINNVGMSEKGDPATMAEETW